MKQRNRFEGFSLIEVLIAISIVALIAVVSLPLFNIGNKIIKDSELTSTQLFELESRIANGAGIEVSKRDDTLIISGVSIQITIYVVAIDKANPNVTITYFELQK